MTGRQAPPAGQLSLSLEPGDGQRLPPRLRPMLPTDGVGPFDDRDAFFEPWWPGSRAFAFLEGGWLRLQTEHLADPLATFPELSVIARQLIGDGIVLDGTLLVLDGEGRPDRELLHARLADPGSTGGQGAFVASDLLWADGTDITGLPFAERHARLSTVLRDSDRCVASRGVRGEGTMLAEAVAAMGIEAVSARRLEARWRPGPAGEDWLRLPVVGTPAAETRPLLVLLQRLPLDS